MSNYGEEYEGVRIVRGPCGFDDYRILFASDPQDLVNAVAEHMAMHGWEPLGGVTVVPSSAWGPIWQIANGALESNQDQVGIEFCQALVSGGAE